MNSPYTIHPCRYDSPERDHIERCTPEEAELYGLYESDDEGCEWHLCDFPLGNDAWRICEMLNSPILAWAAANPEAAEALLAGSAAVVPLRGCTDPDTGTLGFQVHYDWIDEYRLDKSTN